MRPKERESILQRWRSAIQRETRDINSLQQLATRAMNDPDVRTDPTLESMIRSEIEQRRSAFGSEEQEHRPSPPAREFRPAARPSPSCSTPTPPPDPVRTAFERLALTLSRFLEDGNEAEARAAGERMRGLHEENPSVIPAAAIEPYERQIEKLRTHLEHLQEQIRTLTQEVAVASQHGDVKAVASSMLRLSAIHAAYPRLLDEARLEEIRSDIINAAEEHEERLRVQKLVERERVLATEIQRLFAVVREFHRVARAVQHTSEEYHIAETAYLLTIQEVATHDPEWVAGVVLELADLLAECAVPPPEAAGRVDRFLDRIRSSLTRIRSEMRQIENERRRTDDK